MNTNVFQYLCAEYNRLSYTHSYIYGYTVKGVVYAAIVPDGAALLPFLASPDRASSKNGGTCSIKWKQNAQRIAIITTAATEIKALCTVEHMEQLREKATGRNKNRGYLFETLCAKAFNGVLNEKPNADFTTDGDLEIDGVPYQCKFHKATYTDERTLKNLS